MPKLNVALLSYRSNPYSGGQGIYITHLSKALIDLGHQVTVFSGPPYPNLDPRVGLVEVPSLDLYSRSNKFSDVSISELIDPLNFFEWLSINSGGFAEPYTFGKRLKKILKKRLKEFDVVHDNQSLCYELLDFQKKIPLVTTIHHPISKDLKYELQSINSILLKLLKIRWHSFLKMQMQVAKRLKKIIVPSLSSKKNIEEDFKVKSKNMSVILNGIDSSIFFPDQNKTIARRLVSIASADVPLKGLDFLLEAFANLLNRYPDLELYVVGSFSKGGHTDRKIKNLKIEKKVFFKNNLGFEEVREIYCSADIVVIPSLYEGFGFAVGEAMSCKKAVVTTNGGAIPEVIGDCGIIVDSGSSEQLEKGILRLLEDENLKNDLALKGYHRALDVLSWKKVALSVTAVYEDAIDTFKS